MQVELVNDQYETWVPPQMGAARVDQMLGTSQERLIECCGRVCYDSCGSGRPSGEYHRNLLLQQRHFSVAEHVHFTVETRLPIEVWLGIPDCSFHKTASGTTRVTANLRHALEWPNNVTLRCDRYEFDGVLWSWERLLQNVAMQLVPSLCLEPIHPLEEGDRLVESETDTECHLTLFLSDSLVWAQEQNRHRGNISQRSGRFCDQTDQPTLIHPLFKDYLDEVGYLKNETPDLSDPEFVRKSKEVAQEELKAVQADAFNGKPPRQKGESDEPLWEGGVLDPHESLKRTRIGNAVGSSIAQSQVLYVDVVDNLQKWLIEKGMEAGPARKQARSAARYYLPQGLQTEGCYTASIRLWRHIFSMRCTSHADRAIHDVMTKAQQIVKGSRYGHLL